MAPNNQVSASSLGLISLLLSLDLFLGAFASTLATNQIQRGFTATPAPDPSSGSSLQFQPILTDLSSTFSFGFLRIETTTELDIAIVHLPSSFPLWRAAPSQLPRWSPSTSLRFNGSLTLSDPESGVFWSTGSVGDELTLLNSSNLQIVKNDEPIWQSFDYPSDTIVQGQNFTSRSSLLSSNRKFSMSLGATYLALCFESLGGGGGGGARPMYWKRTAMQVKAEIVAGDGPIYARVEPTGFLGVYQNEKAPVDVISFDTFNGGVKRNLRRLTLGTDGNVKAYYWNGSGWVSDFVMISKTCELPAPCGPYGVCHLDGQRCGGCLDSRTADGCFQADSGDLCGSGVDGFRVLRRTGVDLANKELIGFQKVDSLEECEGLCERNCSCWGALYNNASGYCYRVEYPIQTVLAIEDVRKFGYFKVRNTDSKHGRRKVVGIVLVIVGALLLAGGCGFAGYRVWNLRRWRRSDDDEAGMPYKDLNSSLFRSIELANSFRK